MLANTVRTRGVTFAFIIGPPRFVAREEASRVHNAVCDATGHDDLAFRYSPIDTPQRRGPDGFQIVIGRQEGRGGFQIIDELNPTQFSGLRLLIRYDWPPSQEHVEQLADQTVNAVLDAMDGDWQRVMAEVRFRAECNVAGDDALAYVRDGLCRLRPATLENLGNPLTFCSLSVEISEAVHDNEPLANPKREVRIEVLRDDPRLAYIETVNQWNQAPPRTSVQLSELDRLRSFEQNPSDYINDSYDFLTERVLALGDPGGD